MGLGVTAVRGMVLVGDLQEGRARSLHALALAENGGFGITRSQAAEIGADLRSADAALARAEASLRGDPFIGWLRPLPIVGRQLSAADAMVEGARRLTVRHETVAVLLDGLVAARDAGGGAERLATLARLVGKRQADIEDVLTAFGDADRLVSQVSPEGLLGPVASARALLAERLEHVRPLVAGVRQAALLVPSITGVGTEKRYLVLALDNAEIRPIGGLIAAFATPRFTDGLLKEASFRDILSVDRRDQKAYVRPPEPLADHLLGDFTWQVADAGWWPDFAQSAGDARRMYAIETGDSNFQGTIAFTPEFVDSLIEIIGPVEVPQAGITVHAGETYLASLEQVGVLREGEGRKQFLADLASKVLERLFALPPDRYPEVLAALDDAGRRRRLQVLLDDPIAQSVLTGRGWYTPFPFPDGSDRLSIMEANVAPVSKLSVLLDLHHELNVALQPDGSAEERLVTTFTNRFGPLLPPVLERVRSAFAFGNLGSYQRRYLDPGAEVIAVRSDDPTVPITDPDSLELEAGSLAVGNYQFVRPGVVHLETIYTTPGIVESGTGDPAAMGTYRLSFRKQPGRDGDTLVVRVTVPTGTVPTTWSDGGTRKGSTVTFSVTTAFDHTFEVTYDPR